MIARSSQFSSCSVHNAPRSSSRATSGLVSASAAAGTSPSKGTNGSASQAKCGSGATMRRSLLAGGLLLAGSTLVITGSEAARPLAALAAEEQTATADKQVSVYFGSGCFWHVQHEFVVAEQSLLAREKLAITARAGYAGGEGTVRVDGMDTTCYHSVSFPGSDASRADYGRLGHGEVVGMTIPESKVYDFAAEYFKLLDGNGDRPDKADRGPEYRSLIGIPGGVNGPLFQAVARAASEKEMNKGGKIQLLAGKGSDADTLGKRAVWVYDTNSQPFHQAEVYHQFHDGFFPGEDYPRTYNGMQQELVRSGALQGTGCPDSVVRDQSGRWVYGA
ncbi:hypothetical protein PPROV_000360300 [Pycnococcus provasolii]|uniref:Peptide-methionine (S)-S-oxide reductase n=1 Tax=Pycnococcus provasolii TaxID=41880 RepID=A0A830HGT1_9CHLO|nr:hypothetical protein PPROV_000360300 [Pycnococcus provasolii]|mmetsp:Transcript_6443/g.16669  ORF Transcript_6443/g.16669 Transcript_6443/m.16669 type:complete len:333 (-) Transcript_6443:29-1027(-)